MADRNGVPLDGNRLRRDDPSVRDCHVDSVAFDLGFYTEQCRHNDGSAMNDEAAETEGRPPEAGPDPRSETF